MEKLPVIVGIPLILLFIGLDSILKCLGAVKNAAINFGYCLSNG